MVKDIWQERDPLTLKAKRPGWFFDSGVVAALALAAFLIGCVTNALRPEPLPWFYASRARGIDEAVASLSTSQPADTTTESTAPREIRLEDLQAFVADRRGLVVDARPKVFYDQGHVPGAANLPREDFAAEYTRLRELLEAHKEQPITVYCSGPECPDAQLVADALAKLGYKQLLIYTSGWEEWSQTGLPQEGSDPHP